MTIREQTEDFIAQYNALKPKSAEKYDAKRRVKSPSWQTIAKQNGVTRWTDLLTALDLPKITLAPLTYTVTRTIRLGDMYISEEEWRAGIPSVETMAAAIDGKINYEMKSIEKLAKYMR